MLSCTQHKGILGTFNESTKAHCRSHRCQCITGLWRCYVLFLFTMQPKGENVISICLGTACFVKGSGKLLEACENYLGIHNGETTEDGRFTITTLRCVGACALAPVMQINGKTYGNITAKDVPGILETYMKKEKEI